MSEQDAEHGERLRQISQRLREFGIAHQMDDEVEDLIDDLGLPSGRVQVSARTVLAFGLAITHPVTMDSEEASQMTIRQSGPSSVTIEMDAPEVEITLDGVSVLSTVIS